MSGKRLLLIAPEFFSYYEDIINAFTQAGWQVDYIPDRPPNLISFLKIGIRKLRWLFSEYLKNYFLKSLKNKSRYQKILIIKGEGLTLDIFKYIKQNHLEPDGKIYLYLWDSVANSPGAKKLIPLMNKVYTFDSNDAKKMNLNLLPLFYVQNKINNPKGASIQWDLSFLGSIHGDRLKILAKIKKQFQSKYKFFIFVYFPGGVLYLFRKLFDKSFKNFEKSELSKSHISRDKAYVVFNSSKVIIDIHHKNQIGLTMRTMEALAMGKKLVTTNPHVKEYDFFDENQICIIDRNNPRIDESFITNPISIDFKTRMKPYEIREWANRVIN